jgi:predicted FMN-binding regulatory protein PaiB
MVGAIVAFEIAIERIDAKLKLSQNKDEMDRRRVASGLRNEAFADAIATADWMDREAGRD